MISKLSRTVTREKNLFDVRPLLKTKGIRDMAAVLNIEDIKARILNIKPEVVSIVIFGSYARGEVFRDLDILIVVKDAPKGFLERRRDIYDITKSLDLPCRVEILLYTQEECKSNFSDHTPIFLEIACDGNIIYDTGFIVRIMAATRDDIAETGIKRVGIGGWQFPVKWREATQLSPLSNKDWAEIWLKDGRADLLAAEKLFEAGLYAKCATHCQQAVEKAVKAILVCFGRFDRSHYIANLLEEKVKAENINEWQDALNRIVEYCRALEPDAVWSRYPGERDGEIWIPEKEYTADKAQEILEWARFCCEKGEGFVKWWFGKSKQ